LERIFKAFDEDGSGTLELNEFFDMFRSVGIDLKVNDLKNLFCIKDGESKKNLDLTEF
jgi:Ca2+-binding EF-hand superfamily protein